jgi:hypothetical protein
MIQRDSALNHDLNSGNTPASPAADHLESPAPVAMTEAGTETEKLDRLGMESAKRAQHRVQHNEERIPQSTIFSK